MCRRTNTRQWWFTRKGIPAAPYQGENQKLDRTRGLAGVCRKQVGGHVVQHCGMRVTRRQKRVRNLCHILRKSQAFNRRHGRSDVTQITIYFDAHAFKHLSNR